VWSFRPKFLRSTKQPFHENQCLKACTCIWPFQFLSVIFGRNRFIKSAPGYLIVSDEPVCHCEFRKPRIGGFRQTKISRPLCVYIINHFKWLSSSRQVATRVHAQGPFDWPLSQV
jgi:hypothetical protein